MGILIHNGSMWFKNSEKRICAFCKLPHRVYTKTEVSVFDMAILLLVTGLMSLAIWQGPDLRSMLILMGLAFCLQIFLRVRYRESVKCPHCGFDPILYGQNQEQAAQRVKRFLENRKDNPAFMLKPLPQITPLVKKSDDWREAARKAALPKGTGDTEEALDSAEATQLADNQPTPGALVDPPFSANSAKSL